MSETSLTVVMEHPSGARVTTEVSEAFAVNAVKPKANGVCFHREKSTVLGKRTGWGYQAVSIGDDGGLSHPLGASRNDSQIGCVSSASPPLLLLVHNVIIEVAASTDHSLQLTHRRISLLALNSCSSRRSYSMFCPSTLSQSLVSTNSPESVKKVYPPLSSTM
jgi:hypothetical protein